jgi:hypothetical protein
MMFFRVHVYRAIHHNLTTHLPRSATLLRATPRKNASKNLLFLGAPPRQKKAAIRDQKSS